MVVRSKPAWWSDLDPAQGDFSQWTSFDVASSAAVDGPEASPVAHKSTTEAGQQITRDNLHWGSTLGAAAGPISFGFRTSAPGYSVNGEDVIGTFTPLSGAEQTAVRAALQLWASLANISFSDLGNSNNATIEFANYSSSTDNSEAFAFYPGSTSSGSSAGDVFINVYYASTTNDGPGTYEWMAFIHEIGHTLGLEHPGNYNAGPSGVPTYQNSAQYVEDTRQYSLMSYFSETFTGGSYSVFDETPMLHDIAAIQRLYGANTGTRTGNTVYGFNSNAGSPYGITSASQHVVFTIYDAGGTDTLDLSGYFQNQTIDLNPEHFSNAGGNVANISIAQNVMIESGVGGSGSDTIIGNSANNALSGGAGDDRFVIAPGGGADIITDFIAGAGTPDKVDLAAFAGIHSLTDILSRTTQVGADSVIDLGGGDKLTLQHVLKANLSADDFVFTSGPALPQTHWMASIDIGGHPAGWLPAGVGDFNHDGTADLAWYNASTGNLEAWLLANGHWSASLNVGTHATGWQPAGIVDFNSDGTSDFAWYNPTTTHLEFWTIVNGQQTATADVGPHPAGWQPSGIGDFNADGTSDVLWYNPVNRDVEIGKIANGQWTGSSDIGSHPAGWQPAGVGDFNHDGTSDVLWYNPTNGDAEIWKIANGRWAGSSDIGTHPLGWQPSGVADFNNDGTSDILWYNPTNGNVEIWKTLNGQWAGSVNVGPYPGAAQVVGTGDVNHDGTTDILWRDPNTTHIEAWLLTNA